MSFVILEKIIFVDILTFHRYLNDFVAVPYDQLVNKTFYLRDPTLLYFTASYTSFVTHKIAIDAFVDDE